MLLHTHQILNSQSLVGTMISETLYVTKYAQIRKRTCRNIMRHAGLTTLSAMHHRVGWLQEGLRKDRVHFLLFHHVFEDEEKDFSALIQWLIDTGHQLVSYSEAVNRVATGAIDSPYVAISFDDGLLNCRRAGEILHEFGASACFFINSSMIGQTDPIILGEFCSSRIGMPAVEFLSWSDVNDLLTWGNEVGGHTFEHLNLANLDRDQIEEQLMKEREILQKRVGELHHFAWPYGKSQHFSHIAQKIVFESGFTTCASGIRGAHTVAAHDTGFCIRRDQLVAAWPQRHWAYFLARSARRSTQKDNSWKVLD